MSEQDNSKLNRSLELCQRVVTTESFIAEAKEIYGDLYDYGKVAYINKDHRVTVVCPVHGDFQVYAREHLDGKGCPKCEKGKKFIAKLKAKYGDKFGLDEFVYESTTSPVTLICPTHGAFSRLPYQILNYKCGCPECGNELSRQLQEQAHQDAIEHKEERDLARKERYRARKEAERLIEEEKKLAEENFAKERWNEKIRKIIDFSNKRVDNPELDLSAEYPSQPWYEDFFGLNLNFLCTENGTPLNGKQYVFFKPKHWPLSQMKVDVSHGELMNATIYFCDLERDKLYELLLVLEDILSGGFIGPLDDFKEYIQPYINHSFRYDGTKDGFKIVFGQWSINPTIKIRRIKQNLKNKTGRKYQFNFEFFDFSTKKIIDSNPKVFNLPKSFVGIDFETLYPQRVSACSVGLVKYKDGVIVDKYYTFIRPPFDYPGKCGRALTWIHGLTENMVKDAKTFAELLPEIENFVEGLPLVAHNACVERACIRDASAFYGIETKLDFENIIDTLFLSRQAEAKLGITEVGPGTHQLDTVCKRFGITGNNHHNALADAEMSGNLMVLFQKILCDGETVEIVSTSSSAPKQKYNPEDKIQRSDLESVADNPFKNQVVVLTGFAKADSQDYAHKLNELGAIIRDSVNKKTNILITGYNAGPSKMKKAQEVGARIMTEEEFKEIINQL